MTHASIFRTAHSYLSGRTIHLNTTAEFAVPPTFSVEKTRRGAAIIAKHIRDTPTKGRHTLGLRDLLSGLSAIEHPEQLLALVHKLLDFVDEKVSSTDVVHVREVLRKLWHLDLLAWPLLPNKQAKSFKLTQKWLWEPERQDLVDGLASLETTTEKSNHKRIRGVMTLVMASAGSRDIGDFTPEVVGNYFELVVAEKVRHRVARDVMSLQHVKYGSKVVHVLKDFGAFGRTPVRGDNKFQWAVDRDESLAEWVSRASEFMETLPSNVGGYRNAINRLLDCLVDHPEVTRVPEEYLHRDYVAPVLFTPTDAHESKLYTFFGYILDTRCVSEDDYGHRVRLPGFYNPVQIRSRPSRGAETHREAMPTRFVRMLQDILIADDFAWARKYGEARWNRRGGDMFKWRNPDTGLFEDVWSPVRAIALLVKLLLPSRTFQIRMLDSGEADSYEFNSNSHTWVKNIGNLAPITKKPVAKGAFARHRDKDGQEFVFIRFNTNKTADQNKDSAEAGYVMPWQHPEVIRLFSFLRDWQKKHNPINVPTRWVDIAEGAISTRYSQVALEAKGGNCFLFRDPCLPHRDQPVTDARLGSIWRNLNLELESRLAAAGETMPDGSPIVLVEKTPAGSPVYDLHSLRVTLITALAESGVPPAVLMKVVGHASVIMTLYYTKLSPAHICETLNEAEIKLHNREQMNWQAWLANQSRETLVSAVAHTSPSALEALTTGSPTSWIVRDHGVCPVGGTRCQEGGESIIDTKAYQKWGPVPGGNTNCVRCRFFITGPAFLLGLQAYFDNIGYKLKEASQRYQAAKAKFEALEAAYVAKQNSGAEISKQAVHALTVASSHFDQRTSEVDNLAHSWHATYQLIQQSLHIARSNKDELALGDQQYALVAVGGLANVEAILEESSDFEQVDRICQSAVFFEGIDALAPNLKRMRAFDAMLKRNGLAPVFFDLDEQVALEAGNQMAAFMYARFGRDSTNALMAGEETLRRLGVETELTKQLKNIIPLRLGSEISDIRPADARSLTIHGETP